MFSTLKRNLTLFLAISVVSASLAKPGASSDGLVLRFRTGLQTLKVKDSSGKKNNGTPISVVVSNSPSLVSMQDTRQLTLTIWIKPNAVPGEFPVLLSKGGNQQPSAYGGYELILNSHADSDILFTSGGFIASTSGANGSLINSHTDEWIHVAFTMDTVAQTAQFYVNGEAYTNTTSIGDITAVNFDVPNDLYIGTPDPNAASNRAKFDGAIGPVSIYNRVLSADEVQKLFSSTQPKTSHK